MVTSQGDMAKYDSCQFMPNEELSNIRKYKFTSRLNAINETNIVWRNSHNINNKIVVNYHIMPKIMIMFEK